MKNGSGQVGIVVKNGIVVEIGKTSIFHSKN